MILAEDAQPKIGGRGNCGRRGRPFRAGPRLATSSVAERAMERAALGCVTERSGPVDAASCWWDTWKGWGGKYRVLSWLVGWSWLVVWGWLSVSGVGLVWGADPPTETGGAAPPVSSAPADSLPADPLLPLAKFRPESMLKVPQTGPTHARFPVVDCHTHFRIKLPRSPAALDEYVQVMDSQHIAVSVSLDATLGKNVEEHRDFLWTKYRDRFVFFVHVDWQGQGREGDWASWDCQRPDFARRVAQQLRDARDSGASGLKVFKQLGLEYRNADGTLIRIDDERWDPIWAACGELGFPVLMHVADPVAFFQPVDERNERYEELTRRPEWSFCGKDYPQHDELLAAWLRVVARHPQTKFIGAHLASNGEDLRTVATWLQTYPNLYVEIASRISELGRQPYTARQFLIEHSNRVLFGTDGPWPAERVLLYWRCLETWDEYFPYSEKPFPPQGFWQIYGLGLPDEVLERIYAGNAVELIPGVRERWDRFRQLKGGR